MVPLPKPEAILTHESDLDGLLAGLLCQQLATRLFGIRVPLLSFHNHAWKQRAMAERSAWVCDFAFEKRIDKHNWVVFDHHVTDRQPKDATLVHDPNKSAGLICYEVCRNHGYESAKLDRLVHLSNIADLFLENDPEFELATDYANLVKTYHFWNLESLIQGDPERLVDHPLLEVVAVKRRVEDPMGLNWSRQNIAELTPTIGFVNTVVGNTNLIIHQLLVKRLTPYTALITLFRRANGQILVSLRSRDGQALTVAETLQGGGHPNAAGATLPRSVSTIPAAISYLRQTLNPSLEEYPPAGGLESLFDEAEA